MIEAREFLFEYGANDILTIHFPEGDFAADKSGKRYFLSSYPVNEIDIKGTNSAGDSFCAGILYSLHEELPLDKCMKIAAANSRFNLTNTTCTEGIVPFKELEKFISDNR